MLECTIHLITYRGEGILATVVKITSIRFLSYTYTVSHLYTQYLLHNLHIVLYCVLLSVRSYRKSRNKNKFYEEHRAELSLYDTSLRTLKEKSAGNKLPSMKALYAEKDRLIELRDTQREDFSSRRDYEREFRTVSANIDMILGKNHEQEQQIENEKDL